MQGTRHLLSELITLLLVPVVAITIIASAVGSLVGNPPFSGGSSQHQMMEKALREPIIEEIALILYESSLPWYPPDDEVEAVIRASLTDVHLKAITAQVIVALEGLETLEALDSEADLDSVVEMEPDAAVVEIGGLRDTILTGIRKLVDREVATLPICTPEEAAKLAADPSEGLGTCRFREVQFNTPLIDRAFEEVKAEVPDRIDLGEAVNEIALLNEDECETEDGFECEWSFLASSLWGISNNPVIQTSLFLTGMVWSYVGAVILMLALIILNLHAWDRPFRQVGKALLMGAAVPLTISVLAIAYLPILQSDADTAYRLLGAMDSLTHGLLLAALRQVRMLSLIGSLIGLGSLSIAIVGHFWPDLPDRLISRLRPAAK